MRTVRHHRFTTRTVTTRTAAAAVAIVAASGLALTGCGKATEVATEQIIENQAGDGANVDIDDDGNISIDTSDGAVQIGNAELPDGWPLPEPQFGDASLDAAYSSGGQFVVQYSAQGDVTSQAAAYVDGLTSSGFTEDSKTDIGGGTTTWVLSNTDWQVTVLAGFAGDATTIQISAAPMS